MTESPSSPVCKKLNYNKMDMQLALKEINEGGLKIREASRKYNIPRGTLQDRIHGRAKSDNVRLGRTSVLSAKEEECMELWLIKMAKCGFPLKRKDLQNTVQNIVKEDQRPTPFVDQRPGRRWCEAFMKRHPALNERTPESISKARAVVTEEYIRKWFRELKSFLTSINATEILEDPTRILNGDETNFSICPKTGKVIAPKGWKNCYEIKPGSEKETITVLLVFSAAGKTVVPMVVFPYIRPPKEVINSMPPNWFLGRSESGWMRSEIFYEYIANGVNNWLIENQIKKPVLLLVDGHKSHMTMEISEFCDSNGIILYALPANTTHLLQPADVSVFRPLKVEWRKTVKEWQRKEENFNRCLTKATFCPLLEQVLQKDMTLTIKNGFRKCGLYPFNPDAVDYTKCVLNTIERFGGEDSVTKDEKETAVNVLRYFEKSLTQKGINIDQIIEIINGQTNINKNALDVPVLIAENLKKVNSVNIISDEIIALPRENYQDTTFKHRNLDNVNQKAEGNEDIVNPNRGTSRSLIINNKTGHIEKKYVVINKDSQYVSLDNVKIHDMAIKLTKNTASESKGILREATINYKDPDKAERNVESDSSLLALSEIHRNVLSEYNLNDLGQTKVTNIIENDMPDYVSEENLHNKLYDPEIPLPESLINNLDIASDFSFSLLNSDAGESGASTPSNKSFEIRSKSNTPTHRYNAISPCFRKHLFTPKSLSFSKKTNANSKENLPSAISSAVWRNFMKEKERAKNDKENRKQERKNRLKLLREAKAKKDVNLIKKRTANCIASQRQTRKSKKSQPTATQTRIKCVGCEEDMVSDVEENDLKNIGCDKCPRWFHLKCTVHQGRSYEEVIGEEFICHICCA